LCIYLFFKICKRRHAPENNVQYVGRYSVTKEEAEEEMDAKIAKNYLQNSTQNRAT
jgi:hypothetical protein